MSNRPKGKSTWNDILVPIIVAIITALATIIAAYFGYLGDVIQTQKLIEATRTAEVHPTMMGVLPPPPTREPLLRPSDSIRTFPVGQEVLLAAAQNRLFAFDGLQWNQIFTVPEERITTILSDYCDIFIATEKSRGMVYHYRANDREWKVYDSLQPKVNVLIRYHNKIYAGTSPYGIIIEFDGLRWSTAFDTDDAYVTTMAVYNDHLYVGTEWKGIIYKYDGAAWLKLIDTEDDDGGAFPLIVYQQKLFSTLGNKNVLYSYDESQWSEIHRFPAEEALWKGSAIFQDKLYLGPLNSGNIYRYDGVAVELVTSLPASRITAMIEYAGRLFISAWNDGVWTFDGSKWLKETSAPKPILAFSKYVICPSK